MRQHLVYFSLYYNLTKRELQLLELMAAGHTGSHDLAARLGIKSQSVRNQLGRLLAKTGCNNKAALLSLCYRMTQGSLDGQTDSRAKTSQRSPLSLFFLSSQASAQAWMVESMRRERIPAQLYLLSSGEDLRVWAFDLFRTNQDDGRPDILFMDATCQSMLEDQTFCWQAFFNQRRYKLIVIEWLEQASTQMVQAPPQSTFDDRVIAPKSRDEAGVLLRTVIDYWSQINHRSYVPAEVAGEVS